MTAGIPGLGLSGVFVMLSAILTPLWCAVRRDSSPVRPVRVRSILGLALLIVLVTWATWEVLAFAMGHTVDGTHEHAHAHFGTFMGVPILLISLGMLFAIVGTAEVMARVLPVRPTPVNPPVPSVRTETPPPAEEPDEVPATSADDRIDARCRELEDQRAQLRAAQENAADACARLLERLDSEREDMRALASFVSNL
jgi:hypothetical protein